MALGNNTPKTFIGIKEGFVTRKQKDGETQKFNFVEGVLTGLVNRDAEISGTTQHFLDFTFVDGDDTYVLSVLESGSVARSIILSLANAATLVGNRTRINVWPKPDKNDPKRVWTNCEVLVNGKHVDWAVDANDVPKAEKRVIGSTTVIDDTERMKFVRKYIEIVREKLLNGASAPADNTQVDYDGAEADM